LLLLLNSYKILIASLINHFLHSLWYFYYSFTFKKNIGDLGFGIKQSDKFEI